MAIFQIDPLRKFLVTGDFVKHCNVRGCLEPPEKGTYLCSRHLDRALKYFEGQLGLNPLDHMKRDIPLRNNMAWTYFVGSREHNIVKIGVTTRLKARMSSLRNSSPVPVKLFAVAYGWPGIEDALHERFKEHRKHGEWFEIASEIDDCIESIKSHDFSKYIPEGLCVAETQDRVDVMVDSIKWKDRSNTQTWSTKNPVLDFLNGY